MFPSQLDGATVLEYTSKGHYGFLTDYDESNAPIVKELCYYAICRYQRNEYYLFGCDQQYNVMCDYLFPSVEQCKENLTIPRETIWNKK